MEDCLFCKIAAGQIPSSKVFENENYFAFRDISPAAPVHVLVIPKQHVTNALEGAGVPGLMEGLMAAAAQVARQEGLDSQGLRMVINTGDDAGQTVKHLHLHILGGRVLSWPPG